MEFQRVYAKELRSRLLETRRFINVVSGPRQVGKTTLVGQVVRDLGLPVLQASADEPSLQHGSWIHQKWDEARLAAKANGAGGAVLVLDEIQKIPDWPAYVKQLWDEDTRDARPLKVVLLGSAPLLVSRGLSESLAGRFELLHLPHWTFTEMHRAFGLTLDEYIYYGGYPGAAHLIDEPERWERYVRDSLIETSISRDVLLLTRVDKPALMRRLFELSCQYSGQILSYTKVLGQLQDAGNTTTLAHYLDLLFGAGMVCALQKYSASDARKRASSPKFNVMNNALLSAMSGRSFNQTRSNHELWGRTVESAIGAHLVNSAASGDTSVYYWREKNKEVDFVVRFGDKLTAIEVKSGRTPLSHSGISTFTASHPVHRSLLIGFGGVSVEEFLNYPVRHWVG